MCLPSPTRFLNNIYEGATTTITNIMLIIYSTFTQIIYSRLATSFSERDKRPRQCRTSRPCKGKVHTFEGAHIGRELHNLSTRKVRGAFKMTSQSPDYLRLRICVSQSSTPKINVGQSGHQLSVVVQKLHQCEKMVHLDGTL